MFRILIFFLILILALILVFTFNKFRQLNIMQKLFIRSSKWHYAILIIFVMILLTFLILDLINTFTILIHFVIFYGIIFFAFKIFKIKPKLEITIVAFIVTFIYMSYGLISAYHIWQTTYNLESPKLKENIRLVQISDAHMGTTFDGKEFATQVAKIKNLNPDLVVITGDFVDDDTTKEEMLDSVKAFKEFKTKYGIYFVFGNHDKGYYNSRGFSTEDLVEALEENGVKVLEDESVQLGEDIILVGRQDKSDKTRKSIKELIQNLDKSKYIIVLNHQPNDYKNEEKAEVDLVLSGHTHGGQLIPLGLIGILTGSNDQEYGLKVKDKTTFIVSSGISDWALKFKTGTISEYVLIDIRSKRSDE